jgi:hypothetical protein
MGSISTISVFSRYPVYPALRRRYDLLHCLFPARLRFSDGHANEDPEDDDLVQFEHEDDAMLSSSLALSSSELSLPASPLAARNAPAGSALSGIGVCSTRAPVCRSQRVGAKAASRIISM